MARLEAGPDGERIRALESLLGFWALAGVDATVADEPQDRTLARAPRPVEREPLAVPVVAPPRSEPPPPSARLELIRARARQAESLEALKAVAAETQGSERLVFWRGSETPTVAVIGEAPTAEDDLGGAPFLGSPGRLLDRMLAAAGLTGRALITNTLFHRLPGDRPPTAEDQALAAPILERAIELAAPRALFLLGAAAARGVLRREEPITALRGRWLEWRSADGALELPALATFTPSFLLRQPSAKRAAWSDLLLLSERLDRPPARTVKD